MQTALLSASVCDHLDRINCNFIWGGSTYYSHNHLVSWDLACRTKVSRGLGLRKARLNIMSMLAKSSWRIFNQHDSLWCHVFRSTWRGLLKSGMVVPLGCKWRIGVGTQLNFWSDWCFICSISP
ncbi:hypothetical protein PVK06_013204 [Gossypium arboreum]|uniref:Uncharacterized protein n=1 Tax=Gossypium arboreum TaxID=29729 RepID=A0ABR0QEC8_GOSAR|nr:hypothetical protein PVK06_013204 [Gossypium arboreum]